MDGVGFVKLKLKKMGGLDLLTHGLELIRALRMPAGYVPEIDRRKLATHTIDEAHFSSATVTMW